MPNSMVKKKTAPNTPAEKRVRLSRQEWLAKALELLSREGESKLRIDRICSALGVTKGSFYWHFKSRADFLDALVDFWVEHYNRRVPEVIGSKAYSAIEQLRTLFVMVRDEGLAKYDVAFESWAAHEPGIADKIREVGRFRYEYVSGLVRELGFEGFFVVLALGHMFGSFPGRD